MLAHGRWIFGLRMAVAIVALLGLAGSGMTAAQEKPDPQSEIGGLQSKFVDVNGVKARYYEAGAGEPMVMIHGGVTAGCAPPRCFLRHPFGRGASPPEFSCGPRGGGPARQSPR